MTQCTGSPRGCFSVQDLLRRLARFSVLGHCQCVGAASDFPPELTHTSRALAYVKTAKAVRLCASIVMMCCYPVQVSVILCAHAALGKPRLSGDSLNREIFCARCRTSDQPVVADWSPASNFFEMQASGDVQRLIDRRRRVSHSGIGPECFNRVAVWPALPHFLWLTARPRPDGPSK